MASCNIYSKGTSKKLVCLQEEFVHTSWLLCSFSCLNRRRQAWTCDVFVWLRVNGAYSRKTVRQWRWGEISGKMDHMILRQTCESWRAPWLWTLTHFDMAVEISDFDVDVNRKSGFESSLKWLNRFLFCFFRGEDGGFYLFTMCKKKISWPDLNLLVVVNRRKRPNCVDISALDGTGWHYMVFQVANFKIKVGTHTDGYVSSRDISRTPLGQETEESCVAKQWEKRGDERLMCHINDAPNTQTHTLQPACVSVISLAVVTPTLYWLGGECLLQLLLYT